MLPGLDTCWHVGHNGHFLKQKTCTEEQRFEIRHDTIQYFKAQQHTNSFDNDEQNEDQNGNSNVARFGGASIRVEMRVGLMMSNCCAYNKLPPSMLVS